MSMEETPALPHLASEFFTWAWYASEREEGRIDLGDDVGSIDFWVDARLSFRGPDEERARAILTGENPSATLEARAALAGGKVVQDVRLGLRREDREYSVTLKGVHFDLQAVKLPTECKGPEDEALYERMYLYEDLWFVLSALYTRFAGERASVEWDSVHLPAMRAWAAGAEAWDRPDSDAGGAGDAPGPDLDEDDGLADDLP